MSLPSSASRLLFTTIRAGALRAVEKLEERLAADCIDVRDIAVEERDQKTAWYDTLELLVFPAAIALSAAPSVVLNFFKAE